MTWAPYLHAENTDPDETIIKVEYEYRVFNYQRTFTGMSMRAATPDSSVTVSGALWYEADDKNQPLDMQLSDTDQALLATQTDTSKLSFPAASSTLKTLPGKARNLRSIRSIP